MALQSAGDAPDAELRRHFVEWVNPLVGVFNRDTSRRALNVAPILLLSYDSVGVARIEASAGDGKQVQTKEGESFGSRREGSSKTNDPKDAHTSSSSDTIDGDSKDNMNDNDPSDSSGVQSSTFHSVRTDKETTNIEGNPQERANVNFKMPSPIPTSYFGEDFKDEEF